MMSTECYYVILENFKSFHKSYSSQTQQMKSIPKTNISFNLYYDARQKNKYKYINIKTTHLCV